MGCISGSGVKTLFWTNSVCADAGFKPFPKGIFRQKWLLTLEPFMSLSQKARVLYRVYILKSCPFLARYFEVTQKSLNQIRNKQHEFKFQTNGNDLFAESSTVFFSNLFGLWETKSFEFSLF